MHDRTNDWRNSNQSTINEINNLKVHTEGDSADLFMKPIAYIKLVMHANSIGLRYATHFLHLWFSI